MAPRPPGWCLAALCLGAAQVAGAQVAAVPPPAERQTADCSAPVYATDQLVCGDPALRALDRELAARLAAAPLPASRWAEPQWQWFQRRSRCAFDANHRACAEAAYRERLALLDAPPPAAQRSAARCGSPEVAAIAMTQARVVLFGKDGAVLGVAARDPGAQAWQPFLVATGNAKQLRLRSADGTTLNCRL
jgi:uncharacterized protein